MAQQNVGGRARPLRSPQRRVLRIAKLVAIGIVGACVVVGVFAVVFGLLVQWLWNGVVANIFDVKQISYWQALGLVVLARLLVGGLSLGSGGGRASGRRWRRSQREEGEVTAQPAPCQSDYERYWQEEGRAAFAAYMQRQEQAGQQPGPE